MAGAPRLFTRIVDSESGEDGDARVDTRELFLIVPTKRWLLRGIILSSHTLVSRSDHNKAEEAKAALVYTLNPATTRARKRYAPI